VTLEGVFYLISNYRATTTPQILQITTAHAKSFPASCVFTSLSLVTAFNSGDSAASALQVLSEWRLSSNCEFLVQQTFSSQTNWLLTDFVAPVVFHITPRHGPRRQSHSFSSANRFRGNVFTEPFPSSGRLFLLINDLLPSNGRPSIVCFVAVA
jgi:hypothetical protein